MQRTVIFGIAAAVLVVLGYLAGYYMALGERSATQTVTQTLTQTVTATTTHTTYVTQTVTQTATTPLQMAEPALTPISSSTVSVEATKGATVRAGPIIVVIRPGTYVKVGDQMLLRYNFSLVIYNVRNLPVAPDGGVPVYAFAFAVNGLVSPSVTFVDAAGRPRPVITIVYAPRNWLSWTWLGYEMLENGTLIGGRYAFANRWHYLGGDVMVNIQFIRPVPWVFTAGPYDNRPEFTVYKPPKLSVTSGLVPVEIAETVVNGTVGGAVRVGNVIAVIPPGTYLSDGQKTYEKYSFALIYYATQSLSGVNGTAPLGAYAFAANGEVSAKYTFVNATGAPSPIVTVAVLPATTTTWTWLPPGPVPQTSPIVNGTYRFPNEWLYGDGYVVNVQFVRPVPWIFLGPR